MARHVDDVVDAAGDPARSYERLEGRIAAVKKASAVPFMIGGDHGVTYPAVKEAVRDIDYKAGMVTFDTHLDLAESYREDRLTRASPLKRICELANIDPRRVAILGARGPRNVQEWTPIARELGIRIYEMSEIEARGIEAAAVEALQVASPDGHASASTSTASIRPSRRPPTGSSPVA